MYITTKIVTTINIIYLKKMCFTKKNKNYLLKRKGKKQGLPVKCLMI